MDITIDHDSTIPLHAQLLNQIRHLIISGEIGPGSRLPSESELQRHLKISRSTIRQALSNAEAEGLIERVPGKGSFAKAFSPNNQQRNFIGYITFDFFSDFQRHLLSGAESVTRSQGYRILFCNSNGDVEEENRLLDQLLQDGVKGILIWPAWKSDQARRLYQIAKQNSIPIVLMDRTLKGLNKDYVLSDNYTGAYEATKYLIDIGHRKIVFLTRPLLELLPIAERVRGYRKAMDEKGIVPSDPWLIGKIDKEIASRVILKIENSYIQQEIEEISEHLNRGDRPTAIFAMNDIVALQALRAAKLSGIKVPEELSIVGFDDIDIASYFETPLTTVSQNTFYIGKRSAELLIERIRGYSGPPRKELIPTQLRVRESTASPSGL